MDELDRRILRLLQGDGRMTNVELARRAHLSTAATHERVRRLERSGVIEGTTVRLNPAKLGRAMLVFMEITLESSSEELFSRFGEAVAAAPEILECHMVAGGFDYLIKVRGRDMEAFRLFLGRTLSTLPGIRQTHTYTVMEEVKNTTELPL